MSGRVSAPVAVGCSLLLHVTTLLGGTWSVQTWEPRRVPVAAVWAEFEDEDARVVKAVDVHAHADARRSLVETAEPVPIDLGGPHAIERPDTLQQGRGGSERVRDRALNLAPQIDPLSLDRQQLNSLRLRQIERVNLRAPRRSRDNRRAERRPMQLTLVDHGRLPARITVAGSVQIAGAQALHADRRATELSLSWREPAAPNNERNDLGALPAAAGALEATLGSELLQNTTESRALARSDVPTARFALIADNQGRPSDSRLSQARVTDTSRALVHASTLGGVLGEGVGGVAARKDPGVGGRSDGGTRSLALGNGPQEGAADPLLAQYLRRVRGSVDWEDAFPVWAVAEGRGGVAIIRMTILANGNLSQVQVLRGSGLKEFDQNVVTAIRRAAPFAPLPPTLGRPSLALNFSFDATNPAVGRDGGGPGGRLP